MKYALVEGILAVANHKLRVEGIEDYKSYLEKEFLSKEEVNYNFIDKQLLRDVVGEHLDESGMGNTVVNQLCYELLELIGDEE